MQKINLSLFIFLFAGFINSNNNLDEEIVTVASKIPKEIYKVPINVDLIDQEDLEKLEPLNLLSVFSNNLAIDTSSNGGPGQVASLFLRGSNSNHTLVKINGVKINPSSAGGASIYNLDTNLISNIEIGSGPLSSIHGSEAIGGVINISTKNNTLNNSLSTGFGFGPDSHFKTYLKSNITNGGTSINLSYLDNKSNGFPVLKNSTLNRGYENKSFVTNMNYTKKNIDFSISSWSSIGNVEYLVFKSPVSQNYKNQANSIDLKYKNINGYLFAVNLNSSKDLISQNDPNFLGVFDLTDTERKSYEILLHSQLKESNSYSIGYLKEEEDVDYSSYGSFFQKKLSTESFFGAAELSSNSNSFIASIRESKHELYGNQTSWNLGFLKEINKKLLLNISFGSAFRSPNSSELYGFGSNKDLNPEVSRSKEISLIKKESSSSIKFLYFRNKTMNLINFDYLDNILRNIERSSNSGIEIRYKWNNNFLDGKLIIRKQNPKDQENNMLLRRSKQSASLDIFKTISRFEIGFNLSAFSKKNDFGNTKLPGYALLNINATKYMTEKLKLSLRIENITDKNYFTAATSNSYYLNQDRSFWLKINYLLR